MKLSYLLVLSVFLFLACGSKDQIQPPNILFISIDDLRPSLGAFGDSIVVTPNLDQFASEGFTFRNTFCQAGVCAPSRASLMTGLRPDSTRVWHLGDQFRKINPETVTMPQFFGQKGYYTVNIGKIFHNYMPDSISWDEADLRPARYVKPDWLKRDGETFYVNPTIQKQQEIKRDSLLKLRPVRYADGWNTGPAWEMADVHDTMYYDGAQTKLAKETLSRIVKKDQPFFFGLGFFRPHLPFAVPKKYWDLYDPEDISLPANPDIPDGAPIFTMNSMYELRHYDGFNHIGHPTSYTLNPDTARILKHGYYASVSYVDALFGQLVEHLKVLEIYDNTIIIVWGDHGWKLGDHNSWGKMTNYNIDLKVPMMIRYPGLQQPGKETFALTELVDMFPSLVELAGMDVPDYFQGTSFVPLTGNPDLNWKTAAFSQFHRRPRVTPDGGRYMGYSINTKEYHYIEWYEWDHRKGERGAYVDAELYDAQNDPTETINQAVNPAFKSVKEKLSDQLAAGWREART
ncbi:MAG: iduronate 2-sulfatase, partial [Cyclobacteriaceae bacterium]